MNKLLSGRELSGFIKERQAKQVRALTQTYHIKPKLAIISTIDHPAINTYMRMKESYGADVGIDVDVRRVEQAKAADLISQLSADKSVSGIIIQLPLDNPDETELLVNLVPPDKDVDALGADAAYDPATPMAILWLLAGYNIDIYHGQNVVVVGRGKLVGVPLAKMLLKSDVKVSVVDSKTKDTATALSEADVIISGTGQPGLLTSELIPKNCVVVDAGVASEGGETRGDVALDVYKTRDDLKITPRFGGVGPLTVCALFDNVIRAAQAQIS